MYVCTYLPVGADTNIAKVNSLTTIFNDKKACALVVSVCFAMALTYNIANADCHMFRDLV